MTATPASIERVATRQWADLGRAGTWMTGGERVEVVDAARRGDVGADATPVLDAAVRVAREAARLTAAAVDDLCSRGLSREHYVEVVGIVGRVAAIDTYDRGLGRSLRPLPAAADGEPSRELAVGAKRRAGWVPTVSGLGPPTVLEAVPLEAREQRDLHGALYLAYEDMGDLGAVRELTRAQMELVAARVSFLNDCDY